MSGETPKVPERRMVYYWKPLEGEEGPEGKLLPRAVVYRDWKMVPGSEKVEKVKMVVFGASHSVRFVDNPKRTLIENASIPPRDVLLPPAEQKAERMAQEVLLPQVVEPQEGEKGQKRKAEGEVEVFEELGVDEMPLLTDKKREGRKGNILQWIRSFEKQGELGETLLVVAENIEALASELKRRPEKEPDVGPSAKPAEKRDRKGIRFAEKHTVRWITKEEEAKITRPDDVEAAKTVDGVLSRGCWYPAHEESVGEAVEGGPGGDLVEGVE